MSSEQPTLIESRRHQLFPRLTEAEIDRLGRFGERRRYPDGARLFEAGKTGPGMFVILSGRVAITRREGLGASTLLVEQGRGEFVAEVGQLSGSPAFVDGTAVGEVETLLVPPEALRAVLVAEAELGERIMRALILRRVSLIESGAGGPVLIGPPSGASLVRLEGFLSRNGHPHRVLDPAVDHDAAALLERYAPGPGDLPIVVCPDGSVLRNPTEAELARCLGMTAEIVADKLYDVAIAGAGPAGLATAVYAASEGLSVLVVDTLAFGGQAGASARIENYLGFPTGISGMALAGRAFVQAQKFGAEIVIPADIASLDCTRACESNALQIGLADGRTAHARTAVIATGARYRRPLIRSLKAFEGRGVWYWASPIEAKMCAGAEVVLVGGGNSAGQAAVFLSAHARTVHMLVRGPGLAQSMSRYLIDRIASAPNIQLATGAEIVSLSGSAADGLQRVRWRSRATGGEIERDVCHVFLFVGADPATEWLAGCGIALDDKGFVKTGASLKPEELYACGRTNGAAPLPLETSRAGVFAVGDVRSGSVKRVGGAIGEGAAVVAELHAYLAREA